MSIYHKPWRSLLICLCIIGLIPISSEARDDDEDERDKLSPSELISDDKETSPQQLQRLKRSDQNQSIKQRIQQQEQEQQRQPKRQQTDKRDQSNQKESLKERIRYQTQPRQAEQRELEHRERRDQDESLNERSRYQTRPRQAEQREMEHRERSDQDQSLKKRIHQRQLEQHQIERRERSDRDYPSRSTPRRIPRSSHDRYYENYSTQLKRKHHYYQHENYRYHTYFLAPIKRHYLPLNYRVSLLPRTYVRIVVGGWPYFYYDGIFYRHYVSGYIVVRAPIGAVVHVLPLGFIAFSLGGFTYYYVNDTYYIWDDDHEAYVVVDKPDGAEAAIADATEGRVYAYPKQGQSEEQQAKDRYECHRWAVNETGMDPTVDDEDSLTIKDQRNYRRAISACLEGRGYSVK